MNIPNEILQPKKKKSSPVALIIFGIVIIVFGIIMMSFNSENFVKTTGKITEIREILPTEEGEEKKYDVDFVYTIDGTVYHGTFGDMPAKYKVDDDIDVYYDQKNPEKTTNAKISKVIPPIVIGAGAVVAVIGVFQTIRKFR